MRNVVKAIALVFTVATVAFAGQGNDHGNSSNIGQNITVKAKLTRGLSMSVLNGGNATLDFGTLTLPVSTAPVILPTATNAVQLEIVGDNNSQVTLSGTSSAVSLSNGNATLNFTPNVYGSETTSGAGSIGSTVTLSSTGNYYLFVGGTLPSSIGTTQATGQYTGQFEITVAYTND